MSLNLQKTSELNKLHIILLDQHQHFGGQMVLLAEIQQ
jgi:hypothetical protein